MQYIDVTWGAERAALWVARFLGLLYGHETPRYMGALWTLGKFEFSNYERFGRVDRTPATRFTLAEKPGVLWNASSGNKVKPRRA